MNNYYFLFTIVILFNYYIGIHADDLYYDIEAIKNETGWKGVAVQPLAKYNHLSAISQSPYKNKDKEFDPYYYYPESAGQNVDIYIIDAGANLNHEDYLVKAPYYTNRTVECEAIVKDGVLKLASGDEKKFCITSNEENAIDHGTMAVSVAGGNISGVAKKANIHFIASENTTKSHKRAAEYIVEQVSKKVSKTGKKGKTIVSISSSGLDYDEEDKVLLNNLIKNGIIVFVSAANEDTNCCHQGKNFFSYAGYNLAITTGAAETVPYYDGFVKASYSNYGNCVHIFTPGTVTHANPKKGYDKYIEVFGTSCSTPLAAGLAAVIIAEDDQTVYDNEKMKKKLIELSFKDAITNLKYFSTNDTPNYVVNNGKRSIYAPNDFKLNCGIGLDGKNYGECEDGCCSKEGKCIKFENNPWNDQCLIENGCQKEFGTCTTEKDSVKECENLLNQYKHCQISPSDDDKFRDVCSSFRSDECQKFYRLIYADQSVCAVAKKNHKFDYIESLTKEKYNEYANNCNNNLKYNIEGCQKSLGNCYIYNIDEKYTLTLKRILQYDDQFKSNDCDSIYDNIDQFALQSKSCLAVIKLKNSKSYLFNEVIQISKYKNFLQDYIDTLYNELLTCSNNGGNYIDYYEKYYDAITSLKKDRDYLSDANKKKVDAIREYYVTSKNEEISPDTEYTRCITTTKIQDTTNADWGVEPLSLDNKKLIDWCIIKTWSEKLGFPCCKKTKKVEYTDDSGEWGVENGDWCGMCVYKRQ